MNNQIPMVGIRYRGGDPGAKLLARLSVGIGFDDTKEGKDRYFPEVEVEYEYRYMAKNYNSGEMYEARIEWLNKLIETIKAEYAAKMLEIGSFPRTPDGYPTYNPYVGRIEIGTFTKQAPYSDETYYVIRGAYDEMNIPIVKCLSIALPADGGHVSTGRYKASGDIETEYHTYGSKGKTYPYHGYVFYHQSSFGIGD